MTDTYPEILPGYPVGDRSRRRMRLLSAARLALGIAGVWLAFFILQWTSAVRVSEESPAGTLGEAMVLEGKAEKLQWHPRTDTRSVGEESRVVVPQYAGGGRGSTLIGFKAWRFGTIEEQPVRFALCVGLLLAVAAGFALCTWYAFHGRDQTTAANQAQEEDPAK